MKPETTAAPQSVSAKSQQQQQPRVKGASRTTQPRAADSNNQVAPQQQQQQQQSRNNSSRQHNNQAYSNVQTDWQLDPVSGQYFAYSATGHPMFYDPTGAYSHATYAFDPNAATYQDANGTFYNAMGQVISYAQTEGTSGSRGAAGGQDSARQGKVKAPKTSAPLANGNAGSAAASNGASSSNKAPTRGGSSAADKPGEQRNAAGDKEQTGAALRAPRQPAGINRDTRHADMRNSAPPPPPPRTAPPSQTAGGAAKQQQGGRPTSQQQFRLDLQAFPSLGNKPAEGETASGSPPAAAGSSSESVSQDATAAAAAAAVAVAVASMPVRHEQRAATPEAAAAVAPGAIGSHAIEFSDGSENEFIEDGSPMHSRRASSGFLSPLSAPHQPAAQQAEAKSVEAVAAVPAAEASSSKAEQAAPAAASSAPAIEEAAPSSAAPDAAATAPEATAVSSAEAKPAVSAAPLKPVGAFRYAAPLEFVLYIFPRCLLVSAGLRVWSCSQLKSLHHCYSVHLERCWCGLSR